MSKIIGRRDKKEKKNELKYKKNTNSQKYNTKRIKKMDSLR